MTKRKPLEEVISGFRHKHGDKYNYDLVEYINNRTDVIIVCPIHGEFLQQPNNHLSGAGCIDCAKVDRAITNTERYGHKNIAHGTKKEQVTTTNIERYGANHPWMVDFIKTKIKATMVERYGVEHAAQSEEIQNKMKNTCIERYGADNSKQRHIVDLLPLLNDYDWLFDQYITQNKTAQTIANEFGVNSTTIYNYIHKSGIVLRPNDFGFSRAACRWLDSIMELEEINIRHALTGGEYNIPGTNWSADGYCAENNTIYEYHGSHTHGNPRNYQPDDQPNPFNDKTAEELYQKTKEREQRIIELGYNLVVMWDDGITYSLTGIPVL